MPAVAADALAKATELDTTDESNALFLIRYDCLLGRHLKASLYSGNITAPFWRARPDQRGI